MKFLFSILSFLVAGRNAASPLLSVPLTNFGYSYVATVNVADQNISNVIIDTGSSDLIVLACFENISVGKKCFEYKANFTAGVCIDLVEDVRDTIKYEDCATVISTVRLPGFHGENYQRPRKAEAPYASIIASHKVNVSDKELHPWQNSGGILGLGYGYLSAHTEHRLTTFGQLLANASARAQQRFGLDLRGPSEPSWLHLGGDDEKYGNNLLWGEYQLQLPARYHKFMMYEPQICGVSLLASLASSWETLIDTGSECIALPPEFFDVVTSWAPIEYCSKVTHLFEKNSNTPRRINAKTLCFVSADRKNMTSLPWLSFKLQGPNEDPLYVPLSSLLLDLYDSQGHRALCLEPASENAIRGEEAQNYGTRGRYTYPFPPIILGSLALRALYLSVDYTGERIGFSSTLNESAHDVAASASTCVAPAQCRGMQAIDYSANTCKAPSCNKYYFLELDPSSMTCEVDPTFALIVTIVLAMLITMEILLHCIHKRIGVILECDSATDRIGWSGTLRKVEAGIETLFNRIGDIGLAVIDSHALTSRRRQSTPLAQPLDDDEQRVNNHTGATDVD